MASSRCCVASTPSTRPHESLRVSRERRGRVATVLLTGDVAKAQTALRLASSLAPDRQDFAEIAAKADEAALALLDPMDAFAARAEAEAKKALVDSEAKAKREKETQRFGKGKRKLEDDS